MQKEEMQMEKRVGVVGSGPWARFTMTQLKKLGVRELLVGGDPTTFERRHRLLAMAKEFSSEPPLGIEQMVEKAQAVVLCLPPEGNTHWALPALDAGVSVFVQKPIAPSYAEAKKLAEVAEGVSVLRGGSDFPFRPDVMCTKALLSKNAIGEVRHISGQFCSILHPEGWRKDRGPVFDFGLHIMSVVRELMGPCTLSLSQMRKLSGTMKFGGKGWDGDVFLSWESPKTNAPELTLFGSEGTLESYGSKVVLCKSRHVAFAEHLWRLPRVQRWLASTSQTFPCKGEHSYKKGLRNFLRAVETREGNGSFENVLEDLKAMEMAVLKAYQ
jgi:predicted dehydrogenase